MTAPLSAEAYAHIRTDVHQAVLEAQREDPTVTLEILFRLLDRCGELATTSGENYRYLGDQREWAAGVLADVQLRATTKVPYGEPVLRDPFDMDDDERRGF